MNPTDLPFVPAWKNLKVFVLGALWAVLLASGPVLYELWDGIHNYDMIDWKHIEAVAVIAMGGALTAYWRKYKALISPSPVLVENTTQTLRTPPGQPDVVVETHRETQIVKPESDAKK